MAWNSMPCMKYNIAHPTYITVDEGATVDVDVLRSNLGIQLHII